MLRAIVRLTLSAVLKSAKFCSIYRHPGDEDVHHYVLGRNKQACVHIQVMYEKALAELIDDR